jgi:hypothetical protein
MRGQGHKIDEAVTELSLVYYEISPCNLGLSPKGPDGDRYAQISHWVSISTVLCH